MSPPAHRPRLTVVETVYHQSPGEQPASAESRYARELASPEQPYIRRLAVGEDWQPLDAGWLSAAGLLCLANEAPRHAANPGAEERALALARVVEVGVLPPAPPSPARTMHSPPAVPAEPVVCWLVRPGESLRAEPADLSLLRLRCRAGTARCLLTLVPA